jgi:hypothetical protein
MTEETAPISEASISDKTFDVAIIGAGLAGALMAHRMMGNKHIGSAVIFDIGRPPLKRRSQICGWLGCFPNSDGRLIVEENPKLAKHIGKVNYDKYFSEFLSLIDPENQLVLAENPSPKRGAMKAIARAGFEFEKHTYYQVIPKDVHKLSKKLSDALDVNRNEKVLFRFDEEVYTITKDGPDNLFKIVSQYDTFYARNVVLAMGRYGWRQAGKLFHQFGLVKENSNVEFGIRAEMDEDYAAHFNHSFCTLKHKDFTVGPVVWNGTVMPEDHYDTAISTFRANENRWKTNKVSFSILGKRTFLNRGVEELARITNLTYTLADERILKERISTLLGGKSKITGILEEYGLKEANGWLEEAIRKTAEVFPELLDKGLSHVPTIIASSPKINLSKKFKTDVDGLYVIGDISGYKGLVNSAIMGLALADWIRA